MKVRSAWNVEVETSAKHIIECLDFWAEKKPDDRVYGLLHIAAPMEEVTYRQLKEKVDIKTELLRKAGLNNNDRCMLIFQNQIDFLVAFLACEKIGAIPIPIDVPAGLDGLEKWENVVIDSNAVCTLTSADMIDTLKGVFSHKEVLAQLPVLSGVLEEAGMIPYKEQDNTGVHHIDDIAFLQYTSGSTGMPKGVMVTQKSLLSNLKDVVTCAEADKDTVFISWLPYHHDMGLVAMMMGPLFLGGQGILISPAHFMQEPLVWLRAIHEFGGNITGAPNFAYELVADRLEHLSPEEASGLSLHSLTRCFSGAEPIHTKTFFHFYNIAKHFGFSRRSLMFAYGQAEFTLVESMYEIQDDMEWEKLDREQLKRGTVKILEKGNFYDLLEHSEKILGGPESEEQNSSDNDLILIGNGHSYGSNTVMIRNLISGDVLPAYEIGEICVTGPSMTNGYWRRREATQEVFLEENQAERVLRTGDMGFLNDKGELFITGRIKDLIIIRGGNYAPTDLEKTADSAHPLCRKEGSAAFSVTIGQEEHLMLVQEIQEQKVSASEEDYTECVRAIRDELLKVNGILAEIILLVKDQSIPRTPSGKIQRSKSKVVFFEDKQRGNVLYESDITNRNTDIPEIGQVLGDKEAMEKALEMIISNVLSAETRSLERDKFFTELGLNSMMLLTVKQEIEKHFKVSLSAAAMFHFNTIHKMTEHLSMLVEESPASENKVDDAGGITVQFVSTPETRNEPFALNEVQSAYWVGRREEMEWGGVSCYGFMEMDVEGLDEKRFASALQKMMDRHEMLRSVVEEDGKQHILDKAGAPLIIYRRDDISNVEEHLKNIRQQMSCQVLPLGKPMLDVRLSQMEENKWRIHCGIDLMICDVKSIYMFWSDIYHLYQEESLPEIEVSFKDFVAYQEKCKNTAEYKEHEKYWQDKVENFAMPPELPICMSANKSSKGRFVRRKRVLNADVWNRFVQISSKQGLTPSAALFSLYAETLSAFGGGDRFGIVLTVFGREDVHEQIQNVIGDFTKLALLDVKRKAQSVGENARDMQIEMQEAITHSDYSAVSFAKDLNQYRGESKIYPVVFTSGIGTVQPENNIFTENLVWFMSSTPQVYIDHQAFEEDGGIALSWDAIDDLFWPGVLDAMFETYVGLVEKAAGEEEFWSKELIDLRPEEQKKAQMQANATEHMLQADIPIFKKFRENALAHGQRLAVACGQREYSYAELLHRADQVSELLQKNGIQAGDRIIVQMEKSVDQIGVILGISQLGAAYVPAVSNQPIDRSMEMYRSAEAKAVFVDRNEILIHSFKKENAVCFHLDDLENMTGSWKENEVDPQGLAYIIYTSGSTGKPKGVAIRHYSAMNTILDVNEKFHVNENDRILGLSSTSFDLSVYDIFGLLSAGGALILPTEVERMDPMSWRALCKEYHVTLWNSVPALMELYTEPILSAAQMQPDEEIRNIILSGDWIPLGLVDKIQQALPNARLNSMGGATEASIWSNYYPVEKREAGWRSVPYGYPLSNQSFYVLDVFGRPCPDMVSGKLHIAGKGLAQEYYRENELTANAFYIHPQLGIRVYDTGDYGRYMAGGILEFMGRKDQQLKINGYRIEIGEIQAAFAKCGVKDAVILPVGEQMKGKKLVAFVKQCSETSEGQWDEMKLKQALKGYLPGYFIPDKILFMEEFPITANGKIDKKGLVASYEDMSRTEIVEIHTGHTEADEKLLQILSEVLSIPSIQEEDSFTELGVASVDMIHLANRLESVYGMRPSVGEMMRYQRIEELLNFYRNQDEEEKEKALMNSEKENIEPGGNIETLNKINSTELSYELENDLLNWCDASKVKLWQENGKLKFQAPKGEMPPELLADLKKNKEAVVSFLKLMETKPEIRHANTPFRLTPIQLAYVMGRASEYELGNISTHYYIEFETEKMDVERLERAVNEVIQNQEILRVVIYGNGTQRVLKHVPDFHVRTVEGENQMLALRDEWSHQIFPLGQWPMFGLGVSRLESGRVHLHFSMDFMILDGTSAQQLLYEIFKAYEGRPIWNPRFTFRDYMEGEQKWIQSKSYHKKALEYWEEKLPNLAGAPDLPYKTAFADVEKPRFKRLKHSFTKEETKKFNEIIKKYHFTPSAVVCTAYMKTLSHWSERKDLTLNLTLLNRLPLHPDVPKILGDFTNITLISYYDLFKGVLQEEIESVQDQLWKAVENRTVNGIDLLRKLSPDQSFKAVMPVVFTSMLLGDVKEDESALLDSMKEVFGISQTPQVALDHQAYDRGGILTLCWDYVEPLFEQSVIEKMFASYIHLITQMMESEDWNTTFSVDGGAL